MADANPDGLPPRTAENIARFLVVSAREDRGLIRRARPVAPEDFLNRVRDLPAMLFRNATPNATPGARPLLLSGLDPILADASIIDATPRAEAATQRLELAIEAADRSEQSLAAMQFALDRAQRRNLVFGVAACVVVAISLGVTTVSRIRFGGAEAAPQMLAAAAQTAPAVVATAQAAPQAGAAAVTPAGASTLPVPPLPAATPAATAPVHAAAAATVLADNTAPAASDVSSDGQPVGGVPQPPVNQVAYPSTQPRLIDARSDDASALLRSLPPGSIIVSPLAEPPAAAPVDQSDTPPVQPISLTSSATIETLPPRHRYYHYHYVTARRTRPSSPIGGLPAQVGRMVNNLGRDISSLFH
jgi:hypothetical protein